MKFSPIICASLVALVALATQDASAKRLGGDTVQIEINPLDTVAAKACTDSGGTITKHRNGKTFCVKPASAPAQTPAADGTSPAADGTSLTPEQAAEKARIEEENAKIEAENAQILQMEEERRRLEEELKALPGG